MWFISNEDSRLFRGISNMNVIYRDNNLIARLKRFLKIRDGCLICNYCSKPFFNLMPSVICSGCWCRMNDVPEF